MLSAHETILSKQIQWAHNQNIDLIGSKGTRGRLAYTRELDLNLFMPLMDSVRHSFERGDGSEITGSPESPAKMQALHSSSALGVNVFQYWQSINQVPAIASACGFCRKGNLSPQSIVFEEKYPIDGMTRIPPNIDVVIHNSEASRYKRFVIESKFSEPFQSWGGKGLKPAYLRLDEIWADLPELHQFAQTISPQNNTNKHLDTAQLIKHILGLKSRFKKGEFKLLYLYYDAFGEEGAAHRREIEAFTKIARSDGVHFSALSYQELIIRLANGYRQDHLTYVKFLTKRYA